jgi:hypothetical protein
MLSDGSGSFNYSNGADCEWLIALSSANQITIRFTEFSTQKDADTVLVSQCTTLDCGTEQQLAVLSGAYAGTQEITASTGFMKVKFMSDASSTGAGFTAVWGQVVPIVFVCMCVQIVQIFYA